MGEKSPVVSGGQADVSVYIFAGPTCSGTVKYPSGGTHTLAAHTFSKLSNYHWQWTLPSSAGLGTATLTMRCTYGSVTKSGPGSFTITVPPTPTPAPVLGVIVDQPAPGKIEFYIGTHGTIADVCYIDLAPPSGPAPARETLHPTNDQPVWVYDMGTGPTGTWGWTVECVWGTTHLTKSGTFDAS